MKKYKLALWLPRGKPIDEKCLIGCTSFGLSSEKECLSPDAVGNHIWKHEMPGKVLNGTYKEVLTELHGLTFTPVICVVLFKKVDGFEDFLSEAIKVLPDIPFIGGGASYSAEMDEGELYPNSSEVCVLAASVGQYQIETKNIYEDTIALLEFKTASNRKIKRLRELPDGAWQEAGTYYRDKQKKLRIEADNFESISLCDMNGRNLHCSIDGGELHVGANLPIENRLSMNFVSPQNAAKRIREFINDTDSLIFGCAGIRSLIDNSLFTGERSLAGFMFGEIVTSQGKAGLGNLMLTKLKVRV